MPNDADPAPAQKPPLHAASASGAVSPVLTLSNVGFGYDDGPSVVEGLDAELYPGRVTMLIGPNAAGKTTAMRLMLGQLSPRVGGVTLGGMAVDCWAPRRRARRLSYVPQRGAVSFSFTVEEVVMMGRFAVGDRDLAVVGRAIEACELEDLRGRVFSELSGGQQQRVLLARAIAQSEPDGRAVLLDEPAAGMDLWHVHRTMRHLRELAGRGLAVLVVVHDLGLAARYADDVWLMDGGRFVAQGNWDTVLTPAQLEPVYRVGIRRESAGDGSRPVLRVEPNDGPDTMQGRSIS